MSYLTPEGFAERATMLDDALEHQIRIKLIESNLVVGCVCTAENIAKIETADDAWMNWRAFHMLAGLTP
jgi:hypothetical protein